MIESEPRTESLRLTVLSRRECHLCEAMVSDLRFHLGNRLRRGEIALDVVDIDADATLRATYDVRVPVLLADGEHVSDYRVDLVALRAHLIAKLPPAGGERR